MNAFANITVLSTDTAFPAVAQFNCPPGSLKGKYVLSLLWKSGVKVEYSFDGVAMQGDLEAGLPNVGLSFENRAIPSRKIWFRVASATTSVVRVEASVSE
jgi:hypothetical protein